jgi:hypothetical protein
LPAPRRAACPPHRRDRASAPISLISRRKGAYGKATARKPLMTSSAIIEPKPRLTLDMGDPQSARGRCHPSGSIPPTPTARITLAPTHSMKCSTRKDAGSGFPEACRALPRRSEAPTSASGFKNHVLHVAEGYWGGAPEKPSLVSEDRRRAESRQLADAVYAAGVLSHYYTDPVQPFHRPDSRECHSSGRRMEHQPFVRYAARSASRDRRPRCSGSAGPDGVEIRLDGAEFSHRCVS